jgi:hypothetical protein
LFFGQQRPLRRWRHTARSESSSLPREELAAK